MSDYVVPAVLRTERTEDAVRLLRSYATDVRTKGGPAWSGSQFEAFGVNDVNRVTSDDLIAVTMLGVDFPAQAALRILETDVTVISGSLTEIPRDVDLADDQAADAIARGSAAWDLWKYLTDLRGVDMTLASKLMARKRPTLIPVQDSVVRSAVGWHKKTDFWVGLRDMLRRDESALVSHLRKIRTDAKLDGKFADLRVFDIVVWMAAHDTSTD